MEKVLVEKKLDIARGVHAAVTYVGTTPSVILSASGGIDVEKAYHKAQDNIRGRAGQTSFAAWRPTRRPTWYVGPAWPAEAADVLVKLYILDAETDATLVEINPLVLTR